MRTRQLLVGTFLAAFALAGSPVADAAVPTLAGTTVVSGSAVGAMRVRLPKATTISLRPTASFEQGEAAKFSGAGRLLALALVRGDEDETWFTHSGVCMARGCASGPGRFFAVRWAENVDIDETTLPAGNYTLYWIADGKPASVTLRFKGLSGRTTLRPAPQRSAEWAPAVAQDTVDPVTSTGVRTYEGDTEISLPKGALLVDVEWVIAERMNSHGSLCVHAEGETQPPRGCLTMHGAWSEHSASMTCICLTAGTGGSEIGLLNFTHLEPGKYVMQAESQYAGTFGRTGLAIAAVPLLS